MKKLMFFVILLFILTGCKIPKIMMENGKDYKVIEWEGGDYAYVNYTFNGKSYDDALELCREFGNIAKDRNKNETVTGIFPDNTHWKIGIIIKDKFDMTEIKGYKINMMKIDAGTYGDMHLKGYSDKMFYYYSRLKDSLQRDGYNILSPVYEVYNYDTFNNASLPVEERTGDIRYKIEMKKN